MGQIINKSGKFPLLSSLQLTLFFKQCSYNSHCFILWACKSSKTFPAASSVMYKICQNRLAEFLFWPEAYEVWYSIITEFRYFRYHKTDSSKVIKIQNKKIRQRRKKSHLLTCLSDLNFNSLLVIPCALFCLSFCLMPAILDLTPRSQLPVSPSEVAVGRWRMGGSCPVLTAHLQATKRWLYSALELSVTMVSLESAGWK